MVGGSFGHSPMRFDHYPVLFYGVVRCNEQGKGVLTWVGFIGLIDPSQLRNIRVDFFMGLANCVAVVLDRSVTQGIVLISFVGAIS